MKLLFLILSLAITRGIAAQYHTYDAYRDNHNVYTQSLTPLQDGNLLLLAEEDCYTPGAITIEGCHSSIQLLKLNLQGDTIWNSGFSFPGYRARVFENQDRSLTIFSYEREIYTCGQIGSWLGNPSIGISHVSNTGNILSTHHFPEECELALIDVIRISEIQYAILSRYAEWPYWPEPSEGRLFIVDAAGNISKQVVHAGNDWQRGKLFFTGGDSIQMLFIDTTNTMRSITYDLDLNVGSTMDGTQFTGNSRNWSRLNNGDFLTTSWDNVGDERIFSFYRFNSALELISGKTYPMYWPTNILEQADGNFILASGTALNGDTGDVRIHYLDPAGNFLFTRQIDYPGHERPKQLLPLVNNRFTLTGAINCCNLDTLIGPGKSFIMFDEYTPFVPTDDLEKAMVRVFPNPFANTLTVDLSQNFNTNSSWEITFHDMFGRTVSQSALLQPAESLSLAGLAPGMYGFTIVNDHQIVHSGNVVKQ